MLKKKAARKLQHLRKLQQRQQQRKFQQLQLHSQPHHHQWPNSSPTFHPGSPSLSPRRGTPPTTFSECPGPLSDCPCLGHTPRDCSQVRPRPLATLGHSLSLPSSRGRPHSRSGCSFLMVRDLRVLLGLMLQFLDRLSSLAMMERCTGFLLIINSLLDAQLHNKSSNSNCSDNSCNSSRNLSKGKSSLRMFRGLGQQKSSGRGQLHSSSLLAFLGRLEGVISLDLSSPLDKQQ